MCLGSPPRVCLCFGAVLAHNNDKVVHHGFSSFFVIHRKRESAVFSGERNAPARCLPAYNRCSRLTCTQHAETWLSLATSPAIGCGGGAAPPTVRAYWIGTDRVRPLRFPPCMPLPRDTGSKQKKREGCLLYSRTANKHCVPQEFTIGHRKGAIKIA